MHPSSPCPPPAPAAPAPAHERTLLVAAAKALFFQRGIAAVALADVARLHRFQLERFLTDLVTPAGALVARRLQEAHPFY